MNGVFFEIWYKKHLQNSKKWVRIWTLMDTQWKEHHVVLTFMRIKKKMTMNVIRKVVANLLETNDLDNWIFAEHLVILAAEAFRDDDSDDKTVVVNYN